MRKITDKNRLKLLTLSLLAALLPLFFESCSNRLNPATAVPAPVGFTATPATQATATFSLTPLLSVTPTNTATNSPTFANTLTFTNTPVNSFTFTNTPSQTLTVTATNSPTFTNTPVNSFTFTVTPSSTPTATVTDSLTLTNTATLTGTPVNTITPTPTPTVSSTATITPTPTVSSTSTNSPTITPTFTAMNTATITNTPTVTNTPTPCELVGDTNVYPYGGIGVLFWDRIQVPAGVTRVTGYSIYLYEPSPVVPWNYEMALYTDNSGSIGTYISSTDTGEITLSIATPSGIQGPSLSTPFAVTPGQFYWVAFLSSGGLSISTGGASYPFQGSVAYGSLPPNGSGASFSYTNAINHAVLFCP